MAINIEKMVKNALLTNRTSLGRPVYGNEPYFQNTQTRYFVDSTQRFVNRNLQYAGTNVLAEVQGLDQNDFYKFVPARIRVSDVINPTTGQHLTDDWRIIAFENPQNSYIPRGAKVRFNGNVYLVVNPYNTLSVVGKTIIKRCNVTWKHLDEYGNVLTEPFCYGSGNADLSSTDAIRETMILMNGYNHSIMQINENTRKIDHNTRIILGKQAYYVRGLQNFVQEFTEDESSSRIQYFELNICEPLENDDLENRIASGKTFQWEIIVNGAREIEKGTTHQFTARSEVNERPFQGEATYLWESDNPEVATIDEKGVIQGVSEGKAIITCTLAQNPKNAVKIDLQVSEASSVGNGYITWIDPPPESISVWETVKIKAAYIENGVVRTDKNIEFSFSGANTMSYSAVQVSKNEEEIKCFSATNNPLFITVRCEKAILKGSTKLLGR